MQQDLHELNKLLNNKEEEILSELKKENVTILEPIEELEQFDPINLSDYNILPPKVPTESEQQLSCLKYFEQYLCTKYDFKGVYELTRAVNLIRDFEEEKKTYNPFLNGFEHFDDRFTDNNEDKIAKLLEKSLFSS